MLTQKQEEWLNHLSDTNKVKILPYNPKVKDIFEVEKEEIQSILGKDVEVVHRGASNMGISGKGDLDLYIPVKVADFDIYLNKLVKSFGKPGSLYPSERARWNKEVDNIEVEIFLINKEHPAWIESSIFENYLKTHSEALEEYRIIKEKAEGVSTREYYRIKLEFMNKILELAKNVS